MTKKIDYEKWSKDELIKEITRIKSTIYGLVWHRDLPEEKIDVLINPDARTPSEMFPNEMAGKPFPVLKESKTKAIQTDDTKPVNILIEGDNYHSLAVLNFTHQAAIDLIYIDPPYNTGNGDFIYNDLQTRVVQKDDPYRHSKWISFMEKRLKLAQRVLKETGGILISIDDNELAPLKMLCDEIFGENNFITNVVVKMSHLSGVKMSHLDKKLPKLKEYVLFYAKNKERLKTIPIFEKVSWDKAFSRYNSFLLVDGINQNNLKKWKVIPLRKALENEKIDLTDTNAVDSFCYKNASKIFRTARNRSGLFLGLPNDDQFREVITATGLKKIAYKREEVLFASTKLKQSNGDVEFAAVEPLGDLWTDIGINNLHNEGGVAFRNGKKPLKLVKRIISMFPKDSIVLDFMAGSGTTGHAVLEMNHLDSGTRSFILATNDEEFDNDGGKVSHKICTSICYPRIKNAIRGYTGLREGRVPGLGGNLKYYKTDFVEAGPSDKNKRKLVNESTEMLCIKEAAFDLVKESDDFKIFKNADRHLGIIFHEDAIDEYKKAIKKIDGHFNTYVFSMTDDPHTAAFADIKAKVTLCAIPEVILKVYREIFKHD